MKSSLLQLGISIFKQGKSYVAYSPALDLSTAGKSDKDAQKKFAEAVSLFFSELDEQGTTNEILSELGWRRVSHQWAPPATLQRSVGIKIPATV